MNWLDEAKFDIADPVRSGLHRWLYEHVTDPDDIRQFVRRAKVPEFRVRWQQRLDVVWLDVLDAAAAAGKLRAFLDIFLANPIYEGLANELRGVLGQQVLSPAGDAVGGAGAGKSFDWHGDGAPRSEGKEALINRALVDASFLPTGAERAAAVVRLLVDDEVFGTGSLISDNLILTNHHVLFDERSGARATSVQAWFRYERDQRGRYRQEVVCDADVNTIVANAKDDWAVIQLKQPAPEDIPVLPLDPGQIRPGQRAHIIQHPQGGPKMVALFDNDVRYVDDRVVQYLADTEGGSSGSPVFNDRWQIVALHHGWASAPGKGAKPEIRNEGINIHCVLDGLRSAGVSVGDKRPKAPKAKRPAPSTQAFTRESTRAKDVLDGGAGEDSGAARTESESHEIPKQEDDQVAPRLYISFSPKDAAFVTELETSLAPVVEATGLTIWHKAKLRAGEFVSETVKRELRAASLFALIGSADALADKDVLEEWKLAIGRAKGGTAKIISIHARHALLDLSPANNTVIYPSATKPLQGNPDRAEEIMRIVRAIHDLARG